jgi:uncharacterized membrane protein
MMWQHEYIDAVDKSILYLGDTTLQTAASYLAGIMAYYDIDFDYLPSDSKFDDSLLQNNYRAYIVSDYPAKNFSPAQLEKIAQKIEKGRGLLMIGGWESFTGANGEYNNTVLKEVLPVIMTPTDDRVNCPQPCLVEKVCPHEITDSLVFDKIPPTIGGFNSFVAKPDTSTILCARRFEVTKENEDFKFIPLKDSDPLLVLGSFSKGRTAALATDVAPHWVGGFVDWGDQTVKACAQKANEIEIGNWYARFFANLINWTAGQL